MNNLFKRAFLVALVSCISFFAKAQGFEPGQGFKQVNFGLGISNWGVPIYAGMDFGVSDQITIGPRISYRFGNTNNHHFYDEDRSSFDLAFRGDYHFAGLISGLPEQLDLYGGLSLGISIRSYDYDYGPAYNDGELDGSDVDPLVAFQAGGRWYFNRNWAANAELSGGTTYGGLEIGLSYMF